MLVLAPGPEGGPSVRGRRVAVTGLGVVAPCGTGQKAFWEGLLHQPGTGMRRVEDFDASALFSTKEIRRVDRFSQLAAVAADEAVADAGGVDALDPDPERTGVWIGTGVGGLESLETQIEVRLQRGPRRVSPFLVPMLMANSAAAGISMRYGWRGPCEDTVTACAAGTQSIANGARLVASGRCEVVVAGAAEAPLTETGVAGFTNMTALSTSGVSMPFDTRRDGFVLAEGAAVVVLEELGRAVGRGAHVYAELRGAGSTADAHHVTAPAPGGSGAMACMRAALADAELAPADIVHVNAHGTATGLNDASEAAAIAAVFGPAAGPAAPWVTSTKGVTGHALGAAGALEAVAVALSIQYRLIPPTFGLSELDPAFDLRMVTGGPRSWEPGPTMSNSFGFGGHNGCLVITPPST
ncbi:MAG: beta-ketoacyl-[acyl-carrier-protein] synthase family protein [Acidimicrobiales bacterium]